MSIVEDAIHLVEQAVRLLVVGEEDVKVRLMNAYTHELVYVSPENVPEDLSALLKSIGERLTKEPRYQGQSTVESALYRMRRATAAKIANDIFELYLALSRRVANSNI
jgi:hypothetical protein